MNILVLGGAGYIGSRLQQQLAEEHLVDSVDCCWYTYDQKSIRKDYNSLTVSELEKYHAVILLAGHSSVKSCAGDITSPWLNNVTNFTNLLSKLRNDQLVIYASSASVYGNSLPGELHSETTVKFVPVNHYDITKYALDQQAVIANLTGKRVIGLRFGTVNGWSPRLRVDVMINAMYDTVQQKRPIQVYNKGISRALLGIEDLCRAISACITNPVPGIYNLASFNSTVGEIANAVAGRLNVDIDYKGQTPGAYDFSLDTGLFSSTYNFTFTETPVTIVDSLIEKYKLSHTSRRDNYMIYNWEKINERR